VRAGRREERFCGATQVPNFVRRAHGPGWALVGDAGCHKDPLNALGACDALRDAELLAGALADGLGACAVGGRAGVHARARGDDPPGGVLQRREPAADRHGGRLRLLRRRRRRLFGRVACALDYAAAMSRVVVIGATGHVGTYLVPRLVRAGHEVVALSRGEREPYHPAPEWGAVERIAIDREAEERSGDFGERIAALEADAVIDMICFTADSAQQLVDALRPSRPLLVHCGTIWVHGPAARVPVTEDEPRTPYGDYGTGKAAVEALLQRETIAGGVPAVMLHPGHISGPGWPVITPAGNLDPDVWRRLATGEPLALPDLGLGVLHHVHADDVAQAFERALTRPAAIGSSFHVVAEQAMTLRGLATGVAAWFGREPVLDLVDWPEYERRAGAEQAHVTREHVARSIAASIDRGRAVLGYAPRFTALDALREALRWLMANGAADVGGQAL